MDSTTITLFSDILKGAGRNLKHGKKKGGIKAHTVRQVVKHLFHSFSRSNPVHGSLHREVREMKRLVEKWGEDMSARKRLYFAKMQNNSSI